jgi:hypothetical protein
MIAITVSTNYHDILNITLQQNYKFFEKWYIITDIEDNETINVIKKYNYTNVEIIFFNFYERNCKFNKGGAIRFCQEKIIPSSYIGLMLLLDSDIYLPDNFNEIINSMIFQDNTIYGTYKREDFFSYNNFKNGIVDCHYPWSNDFQGYFQLYKFDKIKLYNKSFNCSECDLQFLKHFQNKIIIPNLVVFHLGKSGINWNKRIDKTDFTL